MRRLLALLLLPLGLGGCNAALVGGTVVVMGAGAAIAFDCPGYVNVRLRDELTGDELCGEGVIARSGDRQRRLVTCATLGLSAGTWELRAERGGAPTSVEVDPPDDCQRWVYAVELSLPPPSLPPPALTASSG